MEQVKTDGAVAAEQGAPEPVSVLAAPATGKEFNTIGERLIPKGCFRMEDVRFEFDSSFIKPDTAADMPHLADLIEKHTLKQTGSPPEDVPPPLSIFGHADPVGKEDYNKQLSGRRATAVYAMLVRDVELWEELFTKPFGGDNWGNQSIQTMLATVGHPPGEDSKAAIKSFQEEKGLTVDGVAGPKTRKALYRAYMDFLCGPRLELDKTKNFLAQNEGAGGKGDFQGCSEFNPVLVFSKEEDQQFQKDKSKSERDNENAPNRRVMILLFAPGRRVNPEIWPCPRAKEGVAACRTRFFPDAEQRRSPQENRRKFAETKNTFACRFYQIISDDSPCEHFLTTFSFRLYDMERRFIPQAPFELTVGDKPPTRGRANAKGVAVVSEIEVPNEVTIEWGFPPASGQRPQMIFSGKMFLNPDTDDRETEATQKLHNLAYPKDQPLAQNVAAFQRDYGPLASPPLQETGKLDDPTMSLLRDVYASAEDDLQKNQPQRKGEEGK